MRNPITQHRATALRKRMTDAEQRLWQRLRGRQIHDVRFRRQVPLGHYIADFASHEARIVIELDGGQHLDAHQDDARRDQELVALGYRVLRFWDNDVLTDVDAVLERVRLAITESMRTPPS